MLATNLPEQSSLNSAPQVKVDTLDVHLIYEIDTANKIMQFLAALAQDSRESDVEMAINLPRRPRGHYRIALVPDSPELATRSAATCSCTASWRPSSLPAKVGERPTLKMQNKQDRGRRSVFCASNVHFGSALRVTNEVQEGSRRNLGATCVPLLRDRPVFV